MTPATPDGDFTRNTIAFRVEVPPAYTAEELAAAAQERADREADAWSLFASATTALDAVTDPLARLVLDLHGPVEPRYFPDRITCHGCDSEGHDWEHPAWPCTTVRALAGALNVPLPGEYVTLYRRTRPEAPETAARRDDFHARAAESDRAAATFHDYGSRG